MYRNVAEVLQVAEASTTSDIPDDVLESLLDLNSCNVHHLRFCTMVCMSPGLCLHHMQICGLCKLVYESVHELR